MKLSKAFIFILFSFLSWSLSYSNQSNKATQLIKVTLGMKENYEHLKSINPSVSTFGTEAEKAIFKRALQHHIETELLQLQMDLGKGFEELRRTQEIMIKLFSKVVEENINRTESDLIRLTKLSYGKEKTNTHHFLSMGFREVAVAKQKLLIARNSHPHLYINKIRDLSYALQTIKQGQKYVVRLALMHEGEYESDQDDLNDFDSLKMEIERVLPGKSEYYLKCHYDNNFQIYSAENLFESIWNDPNLHELAVELKDIDPPYVRLESFPEIPKLGSKSN